MTTPWVGERVNASMQDNMDVARAISQRGYANLTEAVAEYEERMLTRGIDLITRSAESEFSRCGPDAPKAIQRTNIEV